MGQQAGLQAGEELEEVAPFREMQRRPLDAVLAHQNYRPAAVNWEKEAGEDEPPSG